MIDIEEIGLEIGNEQIDFLKAKSMREGLIVEKYLNGFKKQSKKKKQKKKKKDKKVIIEDLLSIQD